MGSRQGHPAGPKSPDTCFRGIGAEETGWVAGHGCSMLTWMVPLMTYCHSSRFTCQCSWRMPPGSSLTRAPAMSTEMGNPVTSATMTHPPPDSACAPGDGSTTCQLAAQVVLMLP